MTSTIDTAIVGAGPYGLSLAAHLRSAGVEFRIFGSPMHAWKEHVPPGMFLKSDVFSSSLSDPGGAFPINQYLKKSGCSDENKEPISSAQFLNYSDAFQKRFVPEVEAVDVIAIERSGENFLLRLSTGERQLARRVVVALGLYPFRFIPEALGSLGTSFCSHSAEHSEVESMRGKRVAVVGSGSSAIDLAAALHEGGVDTTIISRSARINFQQPPPAKRPSFVRRMRAPDSGIGSGWKLKICAEYPGLVHMLPGALRHHLLRKTLGPAPGWFIKKRVENIIPIHFGSTIASADIENDGVLLTLRRLDGNTHTMQFDHVISATGYRMDVDRLSQISPEIRRQIHTRNAMPELSSTFESSVEDLYFVGPISAGSFGPVMRFVYGADYMARVLAAHLSRLVAERSLSPASVKN